MVDAIDNSRWIGLMRQLGRQTYGTAAWHEAMLDVERESVRLACLRRGLEPPAWCSAVREAGNG